MGICLKVYHDHSLNMVMSLDPDYKFRKLLFSPNLVLILGKVTKFGGNWLKNKKVTGKVCTISFERPVNYLYDAWHVFPPKYEAWTHFNN